MIDNITLETSTFCNARCIICPNGYNRRPLHQMPLEEIEAILDKFPGLKTIALCGLYEPLADTRLNKILDIIEEKTEADIVIFTNASLLGKYGEMLLNHEHFRYLTCSVHGLSKEVYEEIMVGLDRDVVYDNILNFLELKGGLGKRPKTNISLVRIRQNINEFKDFRKFWTGKADVVSDYEVMNWRGNVPWEDLAYEEPKYSRACPMFEKPIVIDAYGRVVRCCYCFDRNYGHVLKDGLRNWMSKKRDSPSFPKEDCKSCVGWRHY